MTPAVPGVPPEHQPLLGPAPRWPLAVYFHHVHPGVSHYTALSEDSFESALRLLLRYFDPYPAGSLVADGPLHRPDVPTFLVTLDDGYRDCFDRARPLLRRYGISAVFFVITDRVGDRSEDPRGDFLDWEQCDTLSDEGHVVAAHTRTHPRLPGLPAAEANTEVSTALRTIRERYGHSRELFAYPYGLVPDVDAVPPDVLAFGTVRSEPAPWPRAARHGARAPVRRTYLPTGHEQLWPGLVRAWHGQWHGQRHGHGRTSDSDSPEERA